MPNLFKICSVLSNLIHADRYKYIMLFLTLNFRRVLYVVCFLATQTILKFSHSSPTSLRRWNRQSVPKRRHIKFRRRGITQKKTYNNKPIYFDTDVLRQLLGPSGHPQRAKFHPFKTSLSYFLSVLSLTIYKNYNFSRGFVWV